MAPDRCSCTGRGRARLAWVVAPWIALAALPKCPLCIVAYLSAIGIGAGVAAPLAGSLIPIARVAAMMSLAVIVLWIGHAVRRARGAVLTGPIAR